MHLACLKCVKIESNCNSLQKMYSFNLKRLAGGQTEPKHPHCFGLPSSLNSFLTCVLNPYRIN